jgi:hypothetical protein
MMPGGTQGRASPLQKALLFLGASRAAPYGQKTLAGGENRRHMYSLNEK